MHAHSAPPVTLSSSPELSLGGVSNYRQRNPPADRVAADLAGSDNSDEPASIRLCLPAASDEVGSAPPQPVVAPPPTEAATTAQQQMAIEALTVEKTALSMQLDASCSEAAGLKVQNKAFTTEVTCIRAS